MIILLGCGFAVKSLQEIISRLLGGCLAALLNRDRFLRLFNELLKARIVSQRIPEGVQL